MNMPTSTPPRKALLRRRIYVYNTIKSIPTLGVQVSRYVITNSRLFSYSRPVRAGPSRLRMIAPEPDPPALRKPNQWLIYL